jgi:predicted regulator of Ras-like GTPase activity (Roadblock/LC7/MglB family)
VTQDLASALESITRVHGVRGAMLVSVSDGLVVADSLMEGVDGAPVAALTASLAARLRRTTEAAGRRQPTFLHLRAETGTVLAVPSGGDLLVVAVGEPDVNVGLARLEMLHLAERGI